MTITPPPLPLDDATLLDLVRDPRTPKQRWAINAACVGLDVDPYFVEDGEPDAAALALCATCPVAGHCLATALAHEEVEGFRFGWWGGVSPEGRERIGTRLGLGFADLSLDLEDLPLQQRIRRLRADNHTVPQIAAHCGCTERTVYRHLSASA